MDIQELITANARGLAPAGRFADLQDADLWGANLVNADLWGANLQGADLSNADLRGVNLRGANVRGAKMRGADLRGSNLRASDFSGVDLRDAKLHNSNLSGITLRNANLSNAGFHGVNLYGANLGNTNLQNTNLSMADLRNVNFRKSNMHESSKWGGFQLNGLPSGQMTAVPTRDGWSIQIECWEGTVEQLRQVIDGDVYPSNCDAEERDRRRVVLNAAMVLLEAHMEYYADKVEELSQKWTSHES